MFIRGPSSLTRFKFDPIWLTNYIHSKVWDEITYPIQTSTVQMISSHILLGDYLSTLGLQLIQVSKIGRWNPNSTYSISNAYIFVFKHWDFSLTAYSTVYAVTTNGGNIFFSLKRLCWHICTIETPYKNIINGIAIATSVSGQLCGVWSWILMKCLTIATIQKLMTLWQSNPFI